jgi:hypothetical protein
MKKDRFFVLEKILAIPAFFRAATDENLPGFLLDDAIENIPTNETDLVNEFFNPAADFIPAEDTTVRTQMFNLREKLDSYYPLTDPG